MKYKQDAYEQLEEPRYQRHVKVVMPNGGEAVMVFAQLCDDKGNLLPNVTKIEPGYYRFN